MLQFCFQILLLPPYWKFRSDSKSDPEPDPEPKFPEKSNPDPKKNNCGSTTLDITIWVRTGKMERNKNKFLHIKNRQQYIYMVSIPYILVLRFWTQYLQVGDVASNFDLHFMKRNFYYFLQKTEILWKFGNFSKILFFCFRKYLNFVNLL